MSLLDFIERLREKSVSERKQWALGVAFGVTLFIALIWSSLLMMSLSEMTTPENEVATESAVATDTPFGALSQGLRGAWDSLLETLGSLGSVDYSPESSTSPENGLR